MSSIYIAGPMRGIPHYNFHEFDKAHQLLLDHGWSHVANPAEMDRLKGFDACKLPEDTNWNAIPDGFDFEACVTRDIAALRKCDAIYMLDNWEQSKGACAELSLAVWLGKDVIYQTKRVSDEGNTDEKRVISSTGGEKGSKPCRIDLIPAGPLMELGDHFGKGAEKYVPHNWRKGYPWSLSFAAAMRHAWQFWGGEDIDAETGSKHVIATAWHFLALAEFMEQHRNHDDRFLAGTKRVQKSS